MVLATNQHHARRTSAICTSMVIVLNFGFFSLTAPLINAIQLAVCEEYYSTTSTPPTLKLLPFHAAPGSSTDAACGVKEVQIRLAWLLARLNMLTYGCEMLATYPLGVIADRIGTKKMLVWNITLQGCGTLFNILICYLRPLLPTSLMLLSPIFAILGGGSHLTLALIFGTMVKVTASSQRASKLSLYDSILQISQMTGPIFGAFLITLGPFVPLFVGLTIAMSSVPMALGLPRSPEASIGNADDGQGMAEEQERLFPPDETEIEPMSRVSSNQGANITNDASKQDRKLTSYIRTIISKVAISSRGDNQTIIFAIFAFLITAFGKQALKISIQYSSVRFGITIAQAGYIFSIKAASVLVLFLFIIPNRTRLLRFLTVDSKQDHVFAMISIMLLTSGTFVMGVSDTLWVFIPGVMIWAFGFGFSIMVRVLATSSIDENHIGKLYSQFAVFETLGSLLGSSALTASFAASLSMQGLARGLPFLICSGSYFVTLIYFVILRRGRVRHEEGRGSGDVRRTPST